MSEWQPIATAPGPYKAVIIFSGGDVGEGYREQDGSWTWAHDDRCRIPPTHWMLLPEPPRE